MKSEEVDSAIATGGCQRNIEQYGGTFNRWYIFFF